ncbi:MAG: type II toxin-antitoxin system HicA family toxin [Bacteroidales bacterium]|nr:type II toxin-antitoxin system HicA family toxin [Bacteroidales bacterium]
MKYSELERKLKRIGCYPVGKDSHGHPLWYSPRTGRHFRMSHHTSLEVAIGTLKSVKKESGLN